MKLKSTLVFLPFLLWSCYQTLTIDGFSKGKWIDFPRECSTYRMESVQTLIANKETLLRASQNEIESLLGNPEEHELYERNQKFFHYLLTPGPSCGQYKTKQFLSIRFNAVGRASEVQITLRD